MKKRIVFFLFLDFSFRQVVPLVNNASEYFLASLEEHLMLLVVSLNQAVVTSCVSCLGALVNKITKNYKLIRDCFQK